MKYTEFLQFQELLEQNNVTLEEFKKDPKLYESIIGNIMSKLGSGLLNLTKKGIKYAISKGMNKNFKIKLDGDIENIKNNIEQHLGLEGKLPPKDSPVQKVLTAIRNKTVSKKEASTKITKYMEELIDNKSKIVTKSIDNKKGLTEDDKDYLKMYWGSRIADIKLNLIAQLGSKGVINREVIEDESELLHKNLNQYLAILLADSKKRAEERGKQTQPAQEKPAPTPTSAPAQQKPAAAPAPVQKTEPTKTTK